MSQRYFLTTESTYEALRLAVDDDLGYPTATASSIFTPALQAPRDSLRRIVLAVDTGLPGYTQINARVAPLLANSSVQELTESEYLAFLACVPTTTDAIPFSQVSDTTTYTNFNATAGSLADALSGIDSAISARALASDFDQGLKTTDSPEFDGLTLGGTLTMYSGDVTIGIGGGTFQIAGFGVYIDVEQGQIGATGNATWSFGGPVDFSSATIAGIDAADIGAAAASHAHSVADLSLTATDVLVGRSSSGAGAGQEITCTAAGRAILDDADAAAQRTTLGLATVASSGSYTDLSNKPTIPAAATKSFVKFTPADNQPPANNFATLDTRNSVLVLEFDASTDESAVFTGYIPEGATLTNGLKVRLSWMADTATSGNVRWGVQFEADGTDLDSDSFDTATLVTSAANGTSGIETVAEITATAIDSLAAGDRFRLKVYRDADDATNDTMTGDAQLVAVEVQVA